MTPYQHLLKNAGIRSDYKAVLVRGVPQNPMFDVAAFEDIIDNFKTKDGDVFVATYVKAGTTWVQQIIHCLLSQGVKSDKLYGETVPWLEACACSPDVIGPREAPSWTINKINAAPAPRYFKTHATVRDLPRGAGKIKVIYVARNPKDTLVSLFHHATSKPEFEFTGDFQTFLDIFLANLAENGSWFDHVLDWHKHCLREPKNHLFLKYEDLFDAPEAAVRKIAAFLNISLNEETLADTLLRSSLKDMKINASIGMNHLRQGGYGGWRSMFTQEMNAIFDPLYEARMAGSGLSFNFGHAQPVSTSTS